MRSISGRATTASLVLAAALTGASAARAEEASGRVRVVGPAISVEVVLAPEGGNDGPNLCRTDLAKRLRHLAAMTVKVTGEWQLKKDGSKRCFDAADFTVVKATSGRDAVVGLLSEKGGNFVVTGDDGKEQRLLSVPDGLRKLSGQKVILDLKAMESPTAKDASSSVVTYAAYP